MRLNGFRHFLSNTSHFLNSTVQFARKSVNKWLSGNFFKICGSQIMNLNKHIDIIACHLVNYEAIFKNVTFLESWDSHESQHIFIISISAISTKWQNFAICRSAILKFFFIKFSKIPATFLNPTVQSASNSVGKWLRKSKCKICGKSCHSACCTPRFSRSDFCPLHRKTQFRVLNA